MATLEQKLQQYIKENNTQAIQGIMNQTQNGTGVGKRIYDTANSYMTAVGSYSAPKAPVVPSPTATVSPNTLGTSVNNAPSLTYEAGSTNVPTWKDVSGASAPAITPYEQKTGVPQSTAGTGYPVANIPVPNQQIQPSPQYNPESSFLDKLTMIKELFGKKENTTPYSSPYGNTINNLLALLTEKVSNPTQYNPNSDAGLKIAQDNAILSSRRDLGRRGMIGSNSGIYGDMGEIQAAQKLIPQYQQMYQQTEQQKLNNMYNQLSALQGLESTKYNQYRDGVGDVNYNNRMNISDIVSLAGLTGTVNNADLAQTQQTENQNNKFGNAYNPQTGTIQQTPDALAVETARYESSIAGRGDEFNYQAEYNTIKTDGDPSNDYKLAPLARQREAKIQSQIAGLAKYSSDYQAEINKREANERISGTSDPLLPYLKVLRAQKVAAQNAETLSRQDKTIKDAYDRWTKLGVADQTVASVLGIPTGSKTADYQKAMADIAQSNASAASSYASANSATMNAQTNRAELDYKKSQGTSSDGTTSSKTTVNQYYQSAKDMLDKTLDPSYGITQQDVISSVLSFNINAQDKADILNRLGIKK